MVVPCNERSNMFSSSVMDELVAGEDLKVEFYRPADYWTDALPVGNGRLGAMVWGGVQQELLQLNGMCGIYVLSFWWLCHFFSLFI